MADDKKKERDGKLPYEPPRLMDLVGGVAHAQQSDCRQGSNPNTSCNPGGTAVVGQCRAGSIASAQHCKDGGAPGKRCQAGTTF